MENKEEERIVFYHKFEEEGDFVGIDIPVPSKEGVARLLDYIDQLFQQHHGHDPGDENDYNETENTLESSPDQNSPNVALSPINFNPNVEALPVNNLEEIEEGEN